jgi:hypothetical protein
MPSNSLTFCSTASLFLVASSPIISWLSIIMTQKQSAFKQTNVNFLTMQDPFSVRHSPRGIFCTRTLNLRSISVIGYDMDYTLIHYNVMVLHCPFSSFAYKLFLILGVCAYRKFRKYVNWYDWLLQGKM